MINSWLTSLVLIMTLLGALGSVLFKFYLKSRRFLHLGAGFLCFGTGALLNIYLLNKLPYSIVVPANAFTFVWALLFARWIFKETIGILKITGISFIVLGIVLLTI